MKILLPLLLVLSLTFMLAIACFKQPTTNDLYRQNASLPNATSQISDTTVLSNLPRYGINCGHNMYWNVGESTLIVGGYDAIPNEFPYQVAVSYGGQLCGGTIISSQFIMTSAFCGCETSAASDYTITVGEHDFSATSGFEQTYKVSQIHIHPSYSSATNDFDFCILQTSTTITFNTYVQPACLPLSCSDECPDYADVMISGWGSIEDGRNNVDILRKTRVPIEPRADCSTSYSAVSQTITDNMSCAGYTTSGGVGKCLGDRGGPMICYRFGYFQLDGVISFSEGCGQAGYPGVYSRICQVLDWIDTTLTV